MQILRTSNVDAYRVPIHMCFRQQVLRHCASPTRHIRLFKRLGAIYSNDQIHEKVILPVNAKIMQLQTPIMHNSFYDLHHAIAKMNRYSSASAKTYLTAQRNASVLRAVSSAIWLFLRCYILQAGCLDGRLGLVFAILQAQGSLYRGLKQVYPDGELIAVNVDE